MDKNELLKCIDFFKELKVVEKDVTSAEEKDEHCKAVVVDYVYQEITYTTKKLYYKNILYQDCVKNVQEIASYFGKDVFWLDINRHDWPHPKGAEIEKRVINDMYDGPQPAFENFLKTIANNQKNGFLQKITREGKKQHYGFNLENNNHWHDIIKLIQFIISSKGGTPPKDLFENLVFNWHQGKRTSLSGGRAIVSKLIKNIKNSLMVTDILEIKIILLSKKQIILQGPPGTGKTYTAKDLAEQMIFSSVSDNKERQKELLETESKGQFKLIQFHPAYSYEDFVRGIVAESKGNQIEYITKNKNLALFAKEAFENYKDSQKDIPQLTEESWLEDNFSVFKDFIEDEIEKNNGRLLLNGTTTYLKQVEDDCFRYTGDNWNNTIGNKMHFKDILEMYRQGVHERQAIKKMKDVSGLAIQHASYFMKVLDLFYKFIEGKEKPNIEVSKIPKKNFVLIIDEINRANLPAVLGELIYALEYRGEKVESMYATEEDGNTLVIPPNLYIIGTMNTSDRSVGHIDYAIRRRFAFIDVLPKVLEGDNFERELFKQVSTLFIQNFDEYVQDNTLALKPSEYLSEEFRPEDVWLGHSYFIKGKGDFSLRKKYEIIPILKEYVKDGILKQSAESFINAL